MAGLPILVTGLNHQTGNATRPRLGIGTTALAFLFSGQPERRMPAVVPKHQNSNPTPDPTVKEVVGKTGNGCPAKKLVNRVKSFRVLQGSIHLAEERLVEAICKRLASLLDLVTANAVHVPLDQPMEYDLVRHYFSKADRNSFSVMPADGFSSSSASRRRASDTPSSSSWRMAGNDSSREAASCARWSSGSCIALP